MPLGAWLEDWLELQHTQYAASTLEATAVMIRSWINPLLGHIPLDEVDGPTLTTAYAQLLREGGQHNQGLSVMSVRGVHSVLHRALGEACDLGIIDTNAALTAKQPKRDPSLDGAVSELQVWDAEQVRFFLEWVQDDPLGHLWALAAGTGMRRGELLGLRWRDVDFGEATLYVRRNLVVARKRRYLKKPKSGRSRSLSLDETTLDVLRERRTQQESHRGKAGREWQNTWDLVFTDHRGENLSPARITHEFRYLFEHKGLPLPKLRLHDLRHTHATLLLQAGVPINVVSQRLGHANVTITLDVYSHVLPAMDRDAADRFHALVHGTGAKDPT